MPSKSVSPFSRRSFLQLSAATAALQMMSEPMLAAAARPRAFSKDGVMIDSNENPLGPGRLRVKRFPTSSLWADATSTISPTTSSTCLLSSKVLTLIGFTSFPAPLQRSTLE